MLDTSKKATYEDILALVLTNYQIAAKNKAQLEEIQNWYKKQAEIYKKN